MAGEAPNTEAQKTEEVKAETKKETPATPQETADKAKKELDTAKKILTDLQDTLKTGITKGSILNDEALQSTILQATEQLNAEVLKALKDSKVDDKEMEDLKSLLRPRCWRLSGRRRRLGRKKQRLAPVRLQKPPAQTVASDGKFGYFFYGTERFKVGTCYSFFQSSRRRECYLVTAEPQCDR